jgi:hypothetical protein
MLNKNLSLVIMLSASVFAYDAMAGSPGTGGGAGGNGGSGSSGTCTVWYPNECIISNGVTTRFRRYSETINNGGYIGPWSQEDPNGCQPYEPIGTIIPSANVAQCINGTWKVLVPGSLAINSDGSADLQHPYHASAVTVPWPPMGGGTSNSGGTCTFTDSNPGESQTVTMQNGDQLTYYTPSGPNYSMPNCPKNLGSSVTTGYILCHNGVLDSTPAPVFVHNANGQAVLGDPYHLKCLQPSTPLS